MGKGLSGRSGRGGPISCTERRFHFVHSAHFVHLAQALLYVWQKLYRNFVNLAIGLTPVATCFRRFAISCKIPGTAVNPVLSHEHVGFD
ncbi:MAG: hypothetical protein Q8K75_06670 [Chlamydiales bacterium]|nr:hypothetical protein [Chlamydiales bacterium]